MSKFSRIVVLVMALASLLAVMSSTAGAVNFTNTRGTSFHATGGNGTLSVTGSGGVNNLSCTAWTATGSVPMGPFASVVGDATFSPCLLSGTPAHIDCHFTLFLVVWTSTVPAVSSGSSTIACVASTTTGVPLCHIHGHPPVHYVNPNGATPGRLTLTPSSTMTVTHANGTSSCGALVGTLSFAVAHLSEQTATLSGSAGSQPFIEGI